MNECKENRKPLTWLALDALDAKEAATLRAHLKDCAGCREFFKKTSVVTKNFDSAAPDSGIQAPAHFHRQLMNRLQAEKPASAWDELLARLGRMSRPAAVAFVVSFFLALLLHKPGATVSSVNSPPALVAATDVVTDPAPTAANYQIAASQSLSKLDELLTREGNASLPPAPVYRASMRLPDNSF